MDAARPSFSAVTRLAGTLVAGGVYPAGYRYAPHCDERPRISIVLQGALLEEVRSEAVYASAASVVVKPAHVRHGNTFGPDGARLLSVVGPAGLLPELGEASLDRWRWHHGGAPAQAALRFVRALQVAPAEAEDEVWSLFAALVSAAEASSCDATLPDWLRRTKEQLDDAPTASPSVAALAAQADVHPVSLARAFRRHFGCSPSGYRRRQRVRAAAHRLATTADPAVQIALDAGFADQSHMCRDVRAELGLTPRQVRAVSEHPWPDARPIGAS